MLHSSSAHNLTKSNSQREAVVKDGLNFFVVFIWSVSLVQIKTSRPLVFQICAASHDEQEKERHWACDIIYLQQVLRFTQWVKFKGNRLTWCPKLPSNVGQPVYKPAIKIRQLESTSLSCFSHVRTKKKIDINHLNGYTHKRHLSISERSRSLNLISSNQITTIVQ